MKDNSDIPLPSDQLKSKVLVFAIIDEAAHEYEEITKGYVQLSSDQDQKNNTFNYLEVKDQETNQVLMRSNLKFQNNFGKQKGSIISWTDQQQTQYQEIALSFQKEKQCQMFWRVICQKIGKNHLEIKGAEKIQLPNQNNLTYILQQTKNNVELFDYNVAHEDSFILGLKKVYQQMKENSDEMGMGIVVRIINNIMSPNYSSGAIQALLAKDNFKFLLEVQQFKKGINFRQAFEISIENHLSNRFGLPTQIFDKIVLSHSAIFYRENVLNLIQDSLLENMLLMISREAQVEIMSYLNRSKFLQQLVGSPTNNLNSDSVDLFQSQKYQNKKDPNNFNTLPNICQKLHDCQKQIKCSQNPKIEFLSSQYTQKKLTFIFEALTMYQQISSQQIKATFKQNIFSHKIFYFLQACIQNNCLKALQLLHSILQMDKLKFFDYLVQEFKADSSNNLLKILIKKYVKQQAFQKSILFIIESLVPLLNQQKDLFDFFIGTFVFSVISLSKQTRKALALINTLLWNSTNTSQIFLQIKKFKTLSKIVAEYRSRTGLKLKTQELQMVKMLKYILIQLAQKDQKKDKQMEENLIESGFLECCIMIYLKYSIHYNLISSSMLENFRIIQKISYSQIHKYLLQEYSTNSSLMKILKPIQKSCILFQNKNLKNQIQVIESHQLIHKQILQSQHLDNYLMHDEIQQVDAQMNSASKKTEKQLQASSKDNIKDGLKDNIKDGYQNRKDQNLLIFKRILNQISQLQEQLVQKETSKRKLVKKQQNDDLMSIQICLELPSVDQL